MDDQFACSQSTSAQTGFMKSPPSTVSVNSWYRRAMRFPSGVEGESLRANPVALDGAFIRDRSIFF